MSGDSDRMRGNPHMSRDRGPRPQIAIRRTVVSVVRRRRRRCARGRRLRPLRMDQGASQTQGQSQGGNQFHCVILRSPPAGARNGSAECATKDDFSAGRRIADNPALPRSAAEGAVPFDPNTRKSSSTRQTGIPIASANTTRNSARMAVACERQTEPRLKTLVAPDQALCRVSDHRHVAVQCSDQCWFVACQLDEGDSPGRSTSGAWCCITGAKQLDAVKSRRIMRSLRRQPSTK